MAIRIGSSCTLSISMAIGKVVETRRFIGSWSDWDKVSRYAIANSIYLIVTPCINRNDGSGYLPSSSEWSYFIEDTCRKLKSWGLGRYGVNGYISLVNEPMKFCSKEEYTQLINIAYPIVKKYGFLCGAGNEEFITAQAKGGMYQYILANAQFDILNIHIQGSCDSEEKTEYWTNTARQWTNKPIDCTEAFYDDISTSRGWELLKSQLYHAERIGCKNFCNVFNNLDYSAFPDSILEHVKKWNRLSFLVNGNIRSPYWGEWKNLIEAKAPKPNIFMPESEDDMKLNVLKKGSRGNQVLWLQEILKEEYGFENEGGYDGIFGVLTEHQVKEYQSANNLLVDGVIGKNTTFDLIIKSSKPEYF